jgi:hypothetical protein
MISSSDAFGGDAVDWRITSFSGGDQPSCVEAGPFRDGSGRVAVRNSTDPDGPQVTYTQTEWQKFIAGVKAGEFDFN